MSDDVHEFGHTSWDQVADNVASSERGKRRANRACDHCRRMKSRCVRPADRDSCQSCAEAHADCTFSGPRFRSGPPKGYIQALEQRWYQAEVILAILSSSPHPLAQGAVTLLQRDELARDVLRRVNAGPFGAAGRADLPADTSMNDVLSYVTRSQEAQRNTRHSRASREDMSSQGSAMSFRELIEWQDGLASVFASSPASLSPYTVYVPDQSHCAAVPLRSCDDSRNSNLTSLYSLDPEEQPDSDSDDERSVLGNLPAVENQRAWQLEGANSGRP